MRWQTVFSPWRWGRWLWLWFGLTVFAALATPVPVEWSLDVFNAPPPVIAAAHAVYRPAWWCARRSDAITWIFMQQAKVMFRTLGPTENYIDSSLFTVESAWTHSRESPDEPDE